MHAQETTNTTTGEQQQAQHHDDHDDDDDDDDPLEFEDWDGQSPFWIHCAAGSIAGVAEHVSVYPLDTVKTHIQCAACPKQKSFRGSIANSTSSLPTSHMWTTMRQIVSAPTLEAASTSTTTTTASSYAKLFRGVQTMLVGCVPAHALYFSSYEAVKWYFTDTTTGHLPSYGAVLAGAAATIGHDLVMTPMDTIKQRLQLGHYNNGMRQAIKQIFTNSSAAGIAGGGGLSTLYRSFPVTLLTNIPYGAIMVATNEYTKQQLSRNSVSNNPSVSDCLIASSLAGMVASALTTPLDRIKTSLQIQELQPVHCERFGGECATPYSATATTGTTTARSKAAALEWNQVLSKILKEEGPVGLWRGTLPRVLSHTPAVAISWTTYETCKQWLLQTTEGQ